MVLYYMRYVEKLDRIYQARKKYTPKQAKFARKLDQWMGTEEKREGLWYNAH